MAGGMSDYLEKALADHVLGNTAYTAPSTVYLELLTDTNTSTQRDAGTVTPVDARIWTNYARKAVTNNTTNWPNASGVTASKSLNVSHAWDAAVITSGTVTITAIAVYDASTGGNMLYWADLLNAEKIFSAATDDTCTSKSHGFSNDDYVKYSATDATSPVGLTDGAYYYIISAATDTFKLSLTLGGAAVDITAIGGGKVGKSAIGSVINGQVVTVAGSGLTFRSAGV